ncbi:hemolysin family protein [Haloferax mediterranei ATCC 33500]|nr:hemolysin family protein [Haloferax mediterranei]MDX5987705.1 hemolysin family protein [Haloferax mediterranei ATCC 33500]
MMTLELVPPSTLTSLVDGELLTLGGITVLAILMVLSAFFSSSEIAMFSLAQHRIDRLVAEGTPGAETLQSLKSDPHRLLITILVGNNLVNIAMSSIATGLFALYLTQGQAIFAATFGVTALVLLFGESAPKSYAIENAEQWALSVAGLLRLSEYLLYPLVVTFDRLTRVVNRLTGSKMSVETSYVTRDDIQEMILTGENEGVIDADERAMLERIFRFTDTIAKEVMTPRLDITAVQRSADVEEAIVACLQSGHHRMPVYDGYLDNVVGIVELGTLVREFRYGESDPADLDRVIEPTLHVPESKNVDDLLAEMRRERVGMALVIDEFGTTEGLITKEDLVEEIVGEILRDEEDEPIETIDESTLLVRGDVNIEVVNTALGIDLPEGQEFETIAGLVFNRAGRLVEKGETFTHETTELRIERVDNTRVKRVRISKQWEHSTTDEQTTPAQS